MTPFTEMSTLVRPSRPTMRPSRPSLLVDKLANPQALHVMGPHEKLKVSWLLILVVALNMLPAIVIMGLQPQQMMMAPGSDLILTGGTDGMLMFENGTLANSSVANGTECSGTVPNAREIEVMNRDAFPSKGLPSFNMAMNIVGVFSALGTIISNQLVPQWSETYGRKPYMVMNLFTSAFVYVGMFYVATAGRSYWGYCCIFFLQGFFASTMTLVTAYFTDVYHLDGDRNSWSMKLMGVFLLLQSLGVLIAGPFKSVGLFHACWLGVACQIVGFVIVVFHIPESHLPVAQAKLLSGAKKKDDEMDQVGQDAEADAAAAADVSSPKKKSGPIRKRHDSSFGLAQPGSYNVGSLMEADADGGSICIPFPGDDHQSSQTMGVAGHMSTIRFYSSAAVGQIRSYSSFGAEYLVGTSEHAVAVERAPTDFVFEEFVETRDAASLKRDLFRLKIVLAGSVVDSMGSVGFNYALGTLMLLRFPCLADSYITIVAGLIGVYIIGTLLAFPLMENCGYGVTTILGNVAAVVFQMTMAFSMNQGYFIGFMYAGWTLSLPSMMTTNPMIMKFAPHNEIAKWLGMNASIENATSQFGTFIFAGIYEAFVAADKVSAEHAGLTYDEYKAAGLQDAGRNLLITCAAVSFFGTIIAIPTAIWFPPPEKVEASTLPTINIEDMDLPEDGQVSNMRANVLDMINKQRLAAGLPIIHLRFGSYAQDADFGLDDLLTQGHADFLYTIAKLKEFYKETKEDPTRAGKDTHEVETWFERAKEAGVDERMDMANWLCDYFEDAGYNYTQAPGFWKAIFMNAFPPLGSAKHSEGGGEDQVQEILHRAHRFENFAHMHLKMEAAGTPHWWNFGGKIQ